MDDQETITSSEMRALEQRAIASGQVTGLELMEKAGRGVIEAIAEQLPSVWALRGHCVVLCGPGNNGGDGFVVARLLASKGWEVEVFIFGAADALPPDAKTNFERWHREHLVADIEAAAKVDFETVDLVIDALFGIGLSRPITAPVLRDLFRQISKAERPTRIAIDVPSGLDSDTGETPKGGIALRADLTVTFHAYKPCHLVASWPGTIPLANALARHTVVKDIGL